LGEWVVLSLRPRFRMGVDVGGMWGEKSFLK